MLLSKKREWASDTHSNTGESQNIYTEWKKPDKKSTYCMIPLIQNPANASEFRAKRKQSDGYLAETWYGVAWGE